MDGCGYCFQEGGRHEADCPEMEMPYDKVEESAGELAAWTASLRAIAGATSYEDYLARVKGEAGQN